MGELKEVVHCRETHESELCVRIMVGAVVKKEAAALLQQLSAEYPLQAFDLGHLKRAKKSTSGALEVVVCTEAAYSATIPEGIKAKLTDVHAVDTYSEAPESRAEWERWSANWPIHYRPSDLERNRQKGFTAADSARAEHFLRLAEDDAQAYSEEERCAGVETTGMRGGVVVNPLSDKVITSSHAVFEHLAKTYDRQLLATHPLYSAAMLCIYGVGECILGNMPTTEPDALPPMPYLCTGLEFVLCQEPDLTTSMAIVHSRIKCLTFKHADALHGALVKNYRMHDMRALNHRFRVFTVTEDGE
jgi:hypothetical protein